MRRDPVLCQTRVRSQQRRLVGNGQDHAVIGLGLRVTNALADLVRRVRGLDQLVTEGKVLANQNVKVTVLQHGVLLSESRG